MIGIGRYHHEKNSAAVHHFFLTACGAGSGIGLDENGNSPGDTQPTPTPEPGTDVTLDRLVTEIFNNANLGAQRCANCHGGASPLGGMNLETADLAWANLVSDSGEGVTANGNSSFKRVLPGNPEESYIILKLEGDSRAGDPMPLGQSPLNSAQIQLIRDWIANGAPRNGSGTATTIISKLRLESDESQTRLHMHFSRALDWNSLSENAVLVYFQENTSQWLAAPTDYQLHYGEREIQIRIPEQDAAIQGFSVKVNDASLSALYDTRGHQVDGDNNGTDGGEFYYEYRY